MGNMGGYALDEASAEIFQEGRREPSQTPQFPFSLPLATRERGNSPSLYLPWLRLTEQIFPLPRRSVAIHLSPTSLAEALLRLISFLMADNYLSAFYKSFWSSKNLFSKRFLAAGGKRSLPRFLSRKRVGFKGGGLGYSTGESRWGARVVGQSCSRAPKPETQDLSREVKRALSERPK